MGAWFAKFLEANGYHVVISEKKRKPVTHKPRKNRFRMAAHEDQTTSASDVILFATPTRVTRTLLGKFAARLPRTTLLVEISSIKEPIRTIIRTLSRKGTQVLSIHPMFGPGAKNLQRKTVIIAHRPRHSANADKFISTLKSAGAEVVFCDLDRHDRIVAATLALPHLLNCVLVETLRRSGFSVEELRRLGVPAPSKTPTVYTVAPYLALTDEEPGTVEVKGFETSAEVEYVVLINEEKYITVGSDHTDRWLEKISVERAKQVCPKMMGSTMWLYSDLKDHWDRIVIRSFVKDGSRELYQEGSLGEILPVEQLLDTLNLEKESLLFSGTIPVKAGKVIYANEYEIEMEDPVLNRRISFGYRVSPTWP